MTFDQSSLVYFLLSIAVMLAGGRLIGEIARYFKLPMIMGELIAGVLLGPSILGHFAPGVFNSLFKHSPVLITAHTGLFNLSVIMLLLVSGLEVDLSIMVKQRKSAAIIAILSMLLPFITGFLLGHMYDSYFNTGNKGGEGFAIFLGLAFSVSALPVIVRILMDLRIYKSDIGFTIISAAMLIDLVVWIMFSLVLSSFHVSDESLNIWVVVSSTLGFVILTLLVGRKLIDLLLPVIQQKFSYPGGILNFVFVLGLVAAAYTEYIGIHAIFGAFIMGIAIGDSAHLNEETREIIQQFVMNIFAPLFFVSIGLRVDFIQNFNGGLVLILLTFAVFSKIIGTYLGARFAKIPHEDASIISYGMVARGAMEIILGLVALQFNIINDEIFVALVIIAIVTSMISPPLMAYKIQSNKNFLKLQYLINKDLFFVTNKTSKEEIIKDLCLAIVRSANLKEEILTSAVLEREEEYSTGVGHHLAIPHARVDIKRPIIAVAYSKDGIDFEAADNLPAKLIFLLLTPKEQNELQLDLLSAIVKLARDKDRLEKLLLGGTKEELFKRLLAMVSY